MDTISHLSQEQGVTDVQSSSKCSAKVRIHQSEPEKVRHQDDVPPIGVARSGYYAWLRKPNSNRELEDKRLLRLIRASFDASQGVYGAPRVFLDLREAGETCSKHRVARLMRENNIRAQAGYRTRRYISGKPAVLIPNLVKRNFEVSKPNRVWVSDITYIRTWEG